MNIHVHRPQFIDSMGIKGQYLLYTHRHRHETLHASLHYGHNIILIS